MAQVGIPTNVSWCFRLNPDGNLSLIPEMGTPGPAGLGTGVLLVTYGDVNLSASAVIAALQSWVGVSIPFGRNVISWAAVMAAKAVGVPIVANTF